MLYQETEWFLNLIYTLVLFYLSHKNLSLIYKLSGRKELQMSTRGLQHKLSLILSLFYFSKSTLHTEGSLTILQTINK